MENSQSGDRNNQLLFLRRLRKSVFEILSNRLLANLLLHEDNFLSLKLQRHIRRGRFEDELSLLGSRLSDLECSENPPFASALTIGKFCRLRSLRLKDCQMAFLPSSVGQLSHLTELVVSGNHIRELPGALGNLKLLQTVDLTNNKLQSLPECLSRLTSLQILKLAGNHNLRDFPPALGDHLQKLTIGISLDQIVRVSKSLASSFERAEELHLKVSELDREGLEQNDLGRAFPALGRALTALTITFTVLDYIPEEITSLSRLRSLNLSHNRITTVPAALFQLSCLKKLSLEKNRIRSWPNQLENSVLPSLESVTVDETMLEDPSLADAFRENPGGLPLTLMNCENLLVISQLLLPTFASFLTRLTISFSKLSKLSSDIQYFTRISVLFLDFNKLTSVPPEIGCLTQLKIFSCTNNQLQSVPAEIGQLCQLQFLDLSANRLASLPAEIGRLSELKQLRVDDNRLSRIPCELSSLHNIIRVCFDSNPELDDVPQELASWSCLKELWLSQTAIAVLPSEFSRLTNLEHLYITDCPRLESRFKSLEEPLYGSMGQLRLHI